MYGDGDSKGGVWWPSLHPAAAMLPEAGVTRAGALRQLLHLDQEQ